MSPDHSLSWWSFVSKSNHTCSESKFPSAIHIFSTIVLCSFHSTHMPYTAISFVYRRLVCILKDNRLPPQEKDTDSEFILSKV